MGAIGYLLDTHTFLWAVQEEGSRLSDKVVGLLTAADAPIYVSSASAYEIIYKHRIGKLLEYDHVAENFLEILNKSGAYELPISIRHAYFAGKLDWTHRDPFDRMLAAQANADNLTLVTNDPAFQTLQWLSVFW
jgi:PIN domain nuclease of toxin-antitoxin system